VMDAFDNIVVADALAKDSSLRARLILRMKRKFVMRAVERFIQSCVCATVEDVADAALNEACRLNCILN
jgi:hypothetical protein